MTCLILLLLTKDGFLNGRGGLERRVGVVVIAAKVVGARPGRSAKKRVFFTFIYSLE
jgi:hypothetical protein